MKKIVLIICFFVATLISNAEDYSLDNHFMVGANVGLPGGPELKAGYRLTDYLEISASYRFFEYERDVENFNLDDGGTLNGTIKYDPTSAGLFLTVYPFGDDFKITAGRYFSAGTLEGTVTGNPTVKTGGIDQTVNVKGRAELNIGDNVTYLSLGYNLGVTNRFHLEFTAGVQLIKEPDLKINLNVDESSLTTLLDNIDNAGDQLDPGEITLIKDYLAKYNYDLTLVEQAITDLGISYTIPNEFNIATIEQEAKDEVKKAYNELPKWGNYRLLPSVSIGFLYYF